MAAQGWYEDPGAPGTLRWWDGQAWTTHTAAMGASSPSPTPPPASPPLPQSRLRPDGSVRGPAFRAAMVVLVLGVLATLVGGIGTVPPFLESVNGPRFDVPGERTLDLDAGTYVLYELTGSSSGGNGLTFEQSRTITIGPEYVRVTGPGDVRIRSNFSGGRLETIDRGNVTYTGVVRFDVPTEGEYRIEVLGGSAGEVIVGRPVSDLLRRWPYLVLMGTGMLALVAGSAMWIVGATNRRTARRAGIEV